MTFEETFQPKLFHNSMVFPNTPPNYLITFGRMVAPTSHMVSKAQQVWVLGTVFPSPPFAWHRLWSEKTAWSTISRWRKKWTKTFHLDRGGLFNFYRQKFQLSIQEQIYFFFHVFLLSWSWIICSPVCSPVCVCQADMPFSAGGHSSKHYPTILERQ